MSDITRYSITVKPDQIFKWHEDANGQWTRYEDVEELERKVADLIKHAEDAVWRMKRNGMGTAKLDKCIQQIKKKSFNHDD